MSKAVVVPGKCRVCGCTAETPCHDDNGVPCSWIDREHTLCDNLDCIASVPIGEIMAMVGDDGVAWYGGTPGGGS